jgi:hypothetical protein
VDISVDKIRYSYVVSHVVGVEVEVVDMGILIVEVSFESFKRFRFLEQLHNCVEVEIVTRETQVFLRIVLCPDYRR